MNHKVHAGSFYVSVIHRTLTWTTGSLTCIHGHSYACVYLRGLGIPTVSQHMFYSEKLSQMFHELRTGFEPQVFWSGVRCSTSWATPLFILPRTEGFFSEMSPLPQTEMAYVMKNILPRTEGFFSEMSPLPQTEMAYVMKKFWVCFFCFLWGYSYSIHYQLHFFYSDPPFLIQLLPSLYSHRYTHTSERPHQCSQCPKVFKNKSTCAAHERRHNATKSFACQTCSATFPDKGALDKHTRTIHTPSRLFQCTLCGKTGARMDNMRTHIKSHGRDRTVEQMNACIRQLSH